MKALVDGRHRLSTGLCVSPRGRRHGGAAGASIPTPLTLGLFDVVSVRRPVGRRRTALVGIARCGRVFPRAADVPNASEAGLQGERRCPGFPLSGHERVVSPASSVARAGNVLDLPLRTLERSGRTPRPVNPEGDEVVAHTMPVRAVREALG